LNQILHASKHNFKSQYKVNEVWRYFWTRVYKFQITGNMVTALKWHLLLNSLPMVYDLL